MKLITYRVLPAFVLLMTVFFPLQTFAAEKVVITKTYDVQSAADYIEFTLDGYDGAFTSSMTMPNGRVVKMDKSNKISDSSQPYWTNDFAVRGALKGRYTFKIHAPKQAYYNLRVSIPLFSDIPNHWAAESIHTFVQKGIVDGFGDGRFGPNEQVTGEALVKMLVLALTAEQPNGKRQWLTNFRWKVKDEKLSKEMGFQEFSFVSENGLPWSAPYLSAANGIGITKDWSNGEFQKAFKRKDVALLAANVMNMVSPSKPAKIPAFSDIKALDAKYQDAIVQVNNSSIFSGYPDGTFKPEDKVTRAEAVVVLTRLIGFLN
ncbi:S-layer homology domain-containing protein [Paenibacillus alkaliterrae]|nr:S-layer homology domain-containing protein [Paenibacillus alkaliterrae]